MHDQSWFYKVCGEEWDSKKPFPFEKKFCFRCEEKKTIDHWTKSTLYFKYGHCRECLSKYNKTKHNEMINSDSWKERVKQDKMKKDAERIEKYKNADEGRICKNCHEYKDKYNFGVVKHPRSNGTHALLTKCKDCLNS